MTIAVSDPRTHVVDILGGHGGGGGCRGDDGGGAAVGHVIVMSGGLHLHVAALGVFTGRAGGVADGGVGVFTVQRAGAGQRALHEVCTTTHRPDRTGC